MKLERTNRIVDAVARDYAALGGSRFWMLTNFDSVAVEAANFKNVTFTSDEVELIKTRDALNFYGSSVERVKLGIRFGWNE